MNGETTEGSRLCRLDALPDGSLREAREFAWRPRARGGAVPRTIFVVRLGAEVRGYVNRCPHRGTPLNLMPDRFLTSDREHAICATHGALFRLDDGVCVAGPCLGDALERVALRISDGEVRFADADAVQD